MLTTYNELAKDFSKVILAAPSDTVIAAIRDPSTAILLGSLLEGKCSTHIIIKIDSASDTDLIAVIEILKTKYYTSALDIVIVRAGISEAAPSSVASMPLTGIQIHLQRHRSRLLVSSCLSTARKTCQVRLYKLSHGGDRSWGVETEPFVCLQILEGFWNLIHRKIHFEIRACLRLLLIPGFMQTDLVNAGAKAVALEKAYTTIDEGAMGFVKRVDAATK
ncbi:uncharacterized protein RAG0_06052 [Rhynchosporium agropyri]|uniref:Uncharacterized protein n=1 Tax=Rhynchosporium agropyri TaxID=914238 RepID=A0A1E1KFX2_9HELO|nr:uncharacterized protein RAG0_06052 [Rhynchosporium agropyri]